VKITSAMAATFDFTSAGAGLDGTLRIPPGGGGTDYPLTVSSKSDTRIVLDAPASEFLAHVETAWNSSIAASGRTVSLSMDENGRVVLAIDSGTYEYTPSADLTVLLGLQGASGVATHTADVQPPHIVFFGSISGGTWRPVVAGGAEVTEGGKVYAIVATGTSWRRTMRARWIPTDTTTRTTLGVWVSAMRPAIDSLSSVGDITSGRDFSLVDFAHLARNGIVAFASSNFQLLRGGSSAERYYLGYLGPEATLSLSPERYDATWPTWEECDLDFVLPTTGSSGGVT
jgi:hypothetical protein